MTGQHHKTTVALTDPQGRPVDPATLAAVIPGTVLVAEVTAVAAGAVILSALRWLAPDTAGLGKAMVTGAADVANAADLQYPLPRTSPS